MIAFQKDLGSKDICTGTKQGEAEILMVRPIWMACGALRFDLKELDGRVATAPEDEQGYDDSDRREDPLYRRPPRHYYQASLRRRRPLAVV